MSDQPHHTPGTRKTRTSAVPAPRRSQTRGSGRPPPTAPTTPTNAALHPPPNERLVRCVEQTPAAVGGGAGTLDDHNAVLVGHQHLLQAVHPTHARQERIRPPMVKATRSRHQPPAQRTAARAYQSIVAPCGPTKPSPPQHPVRDRGLADAAIQFHGMPKSPTRGSSNDGGSSAYHVSLSRCPQLCRMGTCCSHSASWKTRLSACAHRASVFDSERLR